MLLPSNIEEDSDSEVEFATSLLEDMVSDTDVLTDVLEDHLLFGFVAAVPGEPVDGWLRLVLSNRDCAAPLRCFDRRACMESLEAVTELIDLSTMRNCPQNRLSDLNKECQSVN